MTVIGIILAVLIIILANFIVDSSGVLVLLVILFGLVFSVYQKNKKIISDIKLIREKLGILEEDERTQLEIDKSLSAYEKAKDKPELMTEMNEEIERELEDVRDRSFDLEGKEHSNDKKQ